MRALGIVLAVSLSSSIAFATELEPRAKVMVMLSAHHALPARVEFERAVPEARAVLLAIARDPKLGGPYRARAFAALAEWPDAEVHALFAGAARSEPGMLRHRALVLLAKTFKEASEVAPYLDDGDVELRITAVSALEAIGSDAARAALRSAKDQPPAVLAAIRRVLRD